MNRRAIVVTLAIAVGPVLLAVPALAHTGTSLQDEAFLKEIAFDQKLRRNSPESAVLGRHRKAVRLGEYFGQKPVLMLITYFNCDAVRSCWTVSSKRCGRSASTSANSSRC
jgi:hypothetical protein